MKRFWKEDPQGVLEQARQRMSAAQVRRWLNATQAERQRLAGQMAVQSKRYWKALGKRWPAHRVLREIRRLHRAGRKLRKKTVPDDLYQAGTRHFGNWKTAVEQAGLPYEDVSGVHRWTRRTVVDWIRKLAAKGESLHAQGIRRRYGFLHRAAVRQCGRWSDALRSAGLDPAEHRLRRGRWNHTKARAWVQERIDKGRSVLARDIPLDLKNFVRLVLHTSWTEYVESFGIRYPGVKQRHGYWTPEVVLDEIRRWKAEQAPARPRSARREYAVLQQHARKFFRSWTAACEKAGVNPETPRAAQKPRGRWTKAKAVAWIKKRIATGGSLLLQNVPGDLNSFVVRRFQTNWTSFVESFGVQYPGRRARRGFWSEERVLEEIRGWQAAGRHTNVTTIAREYQALLHQARKYFGSWERACAAAGVEVERPKRGGRVKWGRDRVLAAIRTWHDERDPATPAAPYRECQYLYVQARKLFGSWNAACQAAGVETQLGTGGPPPRWTAEETLEEIRRWKAAGHLTNQDSVNRENRGLLSSAHKYFKTWRAACAAAGVEVDWLRRGPKRTGTRGD